MAPRSATDATRFTSTTPHVSAKAPASAVNMERPSTLPRSLPQRSPAVAGETPQQRVARLRQAATRARDAKISNFDRVIAHGRVWADRAHRFTALSLIGITGIAGAVTVYALGDMIIYNRRKRAEYFAEQKAIHSSALYTAQQALRNNTITDEQRQLLSDEAKAKVTEEAKKANKGPGMFAKGKAWLFSGLKKEEEGEDFGSSERRLGYEGLSEEDDSMGESESSVVRAIEAKRQGIANKARAALDKEQERQITGGPLDRLGTSASAAGGDEEPKSGGWTSFMTRR